jgi:hypothetical protein
MKCIFHVLISFLVFIHTLANAQTIRGVIKNNSGELMPFTSILVKETGQGTMANSEAKFELKLSPGSYTVLFQHIGYQTLALDVSIEGKDIELNPVLTEQQIQLNEVTISQNKEDPAYTIMRKAIAKAPIYKLMVKSYTAKVYIKGGGRLKDVPWLLRRALKKEGYDPDTKYFTESVSEISYTYPNVYKNKAISIRSNMDRFANPNSYINTSFYNPTVGSGISPLSPKAFSYYKFSYLGSFIDKGVEVNKIKVTPKVKGDDVFEGHIYIIDNLWSIHSLDLAYVHEGIRLRANQMYAPFSNVWMPVSNKYDINGKVLGFEFELDYQANIDNYKLVINEQFVKPVEIIDPVVEKDNKAFAKQPGTKGKDKSELEKVITSGQNLSTKSLRKLAKAYMKEEQKARKKQNREDEDAAAIRVDSVIIDSSAYKMPEEYWETVRPIPLTEVEIKSTIRLDSLKKVKEAEAEGKPKKSEDDDFNFGIILFLGHNFEFGPKDSLKKRQNRIRFEGLARSDYNLLEGYAIETDLSYRRYLATNTTKRRPYIQFGPRVRYGLARKDFMPSALAEYNFVKGRVTLEGGRYVSQLSGEESIAPSVNSLYTFFFKRNYLRMYAKDYLKLGFENTFAQKLYVNLFTEWAERAYMFRTMNKPIIKNNKREFFPDIDVNEFVGSAGFEPHRAHTAGFHLTYTPSVRYSISNGRKTYYETGLPYFHFKGRAGIPGIKSADAAFVASALGIEQRISMGARADFLYYIEGGMFIDKQKIYFPDLFHFAGNRTIFITGDPLRSYRLLPYYQYSNTMQYAQLHLVYTPRLLLLNRMYFIDMMGWKESLSYRGLTLPGGRQWSEASYSLDGISRFMRFEVVGGFMNNTFKELNFRIGITLKNRQPSLPRETANDESISINLKR